MAGGRGAGAVLRPLALALAAASRGRGEDAEAAPCFLNDMAYDDGKLAANAGYVSSAEQCQKNCQGAPWCSVFTYRQGPAGSTLGGCWNHDDSAPLQPQVGAVAGPRVCPTPAPTTSPPPTPAPTPAPSTTPGPVVTDASGASQTDGGLHIGSATRRVLMIGVPVLLLVLCVLTCCLCNLRTDPKPPRPEKKEKKKPSRRPAQPVGAGAQTTSRELVQAASPTSTAPSASPAGSFSEAMPLLRVPGLTPPVLPQPVLPPVVPQHLGPEPVLAPLDVALQPLRMPSVSATPSQPAGEAQAQAHPGSFAGVQPASFGGAPSGSFVMKAPPPEFGSSRYA